MSEELQEIVGNSPEWYQAPMTLEEIDRFIIANINTAKRSFIAIGYYLKYVRDRQLYKAGGFSGVLEYAKVKFGIGASQASKYMSINDKFSVNGNSPILLEKYQEFDKTQLSEMLYLTNEQLEQVSVGMTKVEIREIGSPEKVLEEPSFSPAKMEQEPEEPSQAQPENVKQYDKAKGILDHLMSEEWCSLVIWRRFLEKDIAEKGKEEACKDFLSFHGGHGQALKAENGHPKFEFMLYKSQGDPPGKIELQWDNDKAEMPTDEFMDLYLKYPVFDGEKPDDIPAPENDTPDTVDNQPEIVNDVGEDIIPEMGCHNCNYNDVTPEQFKAIDPGGGLPCNICDDKLDQWEPKIDASRNIIEKSDFPCDTCGHDINGCCDYDDESDWCEMGSVWIPKKEESEQVETVEADIIQTVPSGEYDFEKVSQYALADLKSAIMDRQKKLAAYKDCELDAPIVKLEKMVMDALQALEESLHMHDMPELEKPETVQPELPVLKNNDQRKAFIEAYETWPVWIDLEQTGERYYRYDFEDGTSFVIRVSLQHTYEDYSRTENIGYRHEEYFLLGMKNKWIPGMPTFAESSSNKSAMVDHLKELQKKGA